MTNYIVTTSTYFSSLHRGVFFVTVYEHQDHFKHAQHIKSWWPNLNKTDHVYHLKEQIRHGEILITQFLSSFNEFYHECIR